MTRPVTAYLLTCAVIAAAGGVLLIPMNWLSSVLFAALPFASVVLSGFWLLPAIIGMRLLERPGTAVLIGLLSGLVTAIGSGYGFVSVVTNVSWVLTIELAFLLTLYRKWWGWLYFAGAGAWAVIWTFTAAASFDLASMSPLVVAGFFGLVLVSCLAAPAVGLPIADQLRKTGVGRAARRRPKVVVKTPDAPPAVPAE